MRACPEPVADVVVVVAVVVEVEEPVAEPPPTRGLAKRDLSPGEPGAAPRRTWRSMLVRKEFCCHGNTEMDYTFLLSW